MLWHIPTFVLYIAPSVMLINIQKRDIVVFPYLCVFFIKLKQYQSLADKVSFPQSFRVYPIICCNFFPLLYYKPFHYSATIFLFCFWLHYKLFHYSAARFSFLCFLFIFTLLICKLFHYWSAPRFSFLLKISLFFFFLVVIL